MTRSALLPVVVLAVCLLPLVGVAPGSWLVMLVPVAVAAWVLRTGVDVDEDGLTVRTLLGSRPVPWTEVVGIRVAGPGELWVVRTSGTDRKSTRLNSSHANIS